MKKLYAFDFEGHWPAGANGIVSADNVEAAMAMVEATLAVAGLPQKMCAEEFTLLDMKKNPVVILADGDY